MSALLDAVAETAEVFEFGYTSEDVDRHLGLLAAASGLQLVVVWEYVDDLGTGGWSTPAVVDGDRLAPISTALWHHLLGDADPATLAAAVREQGPAALWWPAEDLFETEGRAVSTMVDVGDRNLALADHR